MSQEQTDLREPELWEELELDLELRLLVGVDAGDGRDRLA